MYPGCRRPGEMSAKLTTRTCTEHRDKDADMFLGTSFAKRCRELHTVTLTELQQARELCRNGNWAKSGSTWREGLSSRGCESITRGVAILHMFEVPVDPCIWPVVQDAHVKSIKNGNP